MSPAYLSGGGVVKASMVRRGGRWACWLRGSFARGRPGLLRSAALGLWWAGDEMFDGVIPLGGKRCGRSIFLGRPRGWRVGSRASGSRPRRIGVSEGLTRAKGRWKVVVVVGRFRHGRHSLPHSAAEARVKRPEHLRCRELPQAWCWESCRLTRGARLRYLHRSGSARPVARGRHRRVRAACGSSA